MACVYVISAGVVRHKIGVSKDPWARLDGLQTAHYARLSVVFAVEHPAAEGIEASAHRLLRKWRLCGEWFDISADGAAWAVRHAVAERDLYESAAIMEGATVRCVRDLAGEPGFAPRLGELCTVGLALGRIGGVGHVTLAEYGEEVFPFTAFVPVQRQPSRARIIWPREDMQAANAA